MAGDGDEVADGCEGADPIDSPARRGSASGDDGEAGQSGDVIEREPDYRFTLANERTFLAWMRTSLALLAGGIALRELAEPFDVPGSRTALALAAVMLSLVLAITSYWRWRAVQRAMRRDEPLPHAVGVTVLATGFAIVGAVSAILLVLS